MTAASLEPPVLRSHDDLIKKLLHQPRLLVDFFRAFLPDVFEFADLSHIEYLDKEHPRSRRQPRRVGDVLIKTRWRDQDAGFLIHVESQSTPQPALVERVTEYAMRDSIRYHMPVMPVLLLTYAKPERPPSNRLRWDFGRLASVRVRCPVLHFRSMNPVPHLESANVAALALSALMKLNAGQQVEAVAQTLAETLRQHMSPDDQEAAKEFVKAYAQLAPEQLLQLDKRVDMLSKTEKVLATMPTLINPFIEIGKLKGRFEGGCALVLRQLARKFPGAVKKAAPLVRKLDEEELLTFGEALLFMNDAKQCLAWLKERQKKA